MVDPRIYRAFLVLVALAVIVFGFSLKNQAGGVGTTLPAGQAFASSYDTMTTLSDQFRDRSPGGSSDARLASYFEGQFAGGGTSISGFQVSTQQFNARTADGDQILTNVLAYRPGLGSGEIVVVAHRDSAATNRHDQAATADMSGTAVLIGLARALSGETLHRSVLLISTSGQVGAAGAAQLASSLSSQQVDAVIVLGDLAGKSHRSPVVVPWSSGDKLAPPLLRNTLASFVGQQTGIAVHSTGLAGQFVRLAVPFSVTEQAPFLAAGLPAVLLSVSGDTVTAADAALAPRTQIAGLGAAVLQTVNALDQGSAVPAPSAYLVISGKIVPLWAVRLLMLALIAPVAATAVDALARTRRRGHSIMRWVAWVLCGAIPFLVGLGALLLARVTNALSATPPGAVAGNAVRMGAGGVEVLLAVLLVVILTFVFLRPLCLKAIASASGSVRIGDSRRSPETPAADAAAVALTLVLCGVALAVWALNPFAALLLVPGLHLWLWLAQPGVRRHRWALLLLTLLALVPAIGVLVYYSNAYALTPFALVWSGALMIAGGAMPITIAVCWAVALGCLASALVIAVRSVRVVAAATDPVVTVRGPASYAGPGSLGGTESALRR